MGALPAVRRILKRRLQHAAARFGPHTRKHRTPQLVILMYHRVLPADDPRARHEEPGMLVTPETFEKHLTWLREYFEPVMLSEWLDRKRLGLALPERACAITFDDGWADNHEFAWPVLRNHSIPATVFLVADMIGSNREFWPERLARIAAAVARLPAPDRSLPQLEWLQELAAGFAFEDNAPTPGEISEMIAAAKSLPDKEITGRLDNIEDMLDLDTHTRAASLMSWEQVAEMVDGGTMETGSHTCNHIRLNPSVPGRVIAHEITASKNIIEQHTRKEVKTFCYPNGDLCPRALDLVRQNYLGAVTTSRGWNSTSTDNHLLQRIGLHEDISSDKIAFLARVSGWL